jgi:hypothetical protein
MIGYVKRKKYLVGDDIPMKYTKIFLQLCVEEGLSLLAEIVSLLC